MKRRRRPTETSKRNRGQQVLPGVLLHVVEATSPIEHLVDRSEWQLSAEKMANDAIRLLDIDDRDAAHGSVIRRLTASFGVEDGAGGYAENSLSRPPDRGYFGVELGEICVA